MDAIVFVLRTGCQWGARDATEICSRSSAHRRFQEWVAAGVFVNLWAAGLQEYDQSKGLDSEWLAMDGALIKAPLGGERTGRNPTDRGKLGTKRSLLTEANGVPVGLAVEGANRHDKKLAEATLESIPVEPPEPTPEKPQGMCLDKGYDYDDTREFPAVRRPVDLERLTRRFPRAGPPVRPVFIGAGATNGDVGVDAKGMFLAAAAGPVYKLLGKADLGTADFFLQAAQWRSHQRPEMADFTFAVRYINGQALPEKRPATAPQ